MLSKSAPHSEYCSVVSEFDLNTAAEIETHTRLPDAVDSFIMTQVRSKVKVTTTYKNRHMFQFFCEHSVDL